MSGEYLSDFIADILDFAPKPPPPPRRACHRRPWGGRGGGGRGGDAVHGELHVEDLVAVETRIGRAATTVLLLLGETFLDARRKSTKTCSMSRP